MREVSPRQIRMLIVRAMRLGYSSDELDRLEQVQTRDEFARSLRIIEGLENKRRQKKG